MKPFIICALTLLPTTSLSAQSAAPKPYTWRNAAIVGGGFVSGVQAHPTVPGLFYAKTDIGGAYRKDSVEGKWIPITDWIPQEHWTYTGIESLALDPNRPDAVYIAGGSYTNAWSGPGAMLRSDDRGKTWNVTPMTFKMGGNENGRGAGERLAVDPHLGSVLMFGSRNDGLWKSDDRCVTWKRAESFPKLDSSTKGQGIYFIHFDAATGTANQPSPVVIAATADHKSPLYRSTDAGMTWKTVPNQPVDLMPRHCVQDDQGNVFITYGNGPGPNDVTNGALYRWNLKTDEFTNVSPVKPGGDDKFCYAGIALDAQKPGVIVVSTLDRWAKQDDIFRSVDRGKTWKSIREKSVRDWSAAPWLKFDRDSVGIGHWIVDVAIDPHNSNRMFYVTGWGMWETDDLTAADRDLPTHWKVAAKGIEEVVANDLISPPSGAHLLAVMWDIDGFRWEDKFDVSPAKGMFKPSYGGNFSIDFAESDPKLVVRVYGGQSVGGSEGSGNGGSISRDNGVTWAKFATSPPVEKAVNGMVAMSPDGKWIVWTPEDLPTFVTDDAGRTWIKSEELPPKLRVVSDRKDSNAFYAFEADTGTFFASSDGGKHFSAVNHDLPHGDGYLKAVPGKAGEIWLGSDKGLFKSSNGGQSFARVGTSITAHRLGFGMHAPTRTEPSVFVVGRLDGVYGFFRSDDSGTSWIRINDDDHQFGEITAIGGDPRMFGRAYVASRNRGVLIGLSE